MFHMWRRRSFARECKNKNNNLARAATMEDVDLPNDFDLVFVDLNETDSDAI